MELTQKKISGAVVIALKDALAVIYWRRQDVRMFIEGSMKNTAIIGTIDWNLPKIESVSLLIDRMVKRDDIYIDDLRQLIYDVSNMSDFSHLKRWEDADTKIDKAKAAVESLRGLSKGHFDIIKEKEEINKRKANHSDRMKTTSTFSEKLDALDIRFKSLSTSNETPQSKGYEMERILNELFELFDLRPRKPFKNLGEQIDGAFNLKGDEFLLEAKFCKDPIGAAELKNFGGTIAGTLKTTLGLYFSMNGFTTLGLQSMGHKPDKSMILMDGFDLTNVLDGRISLVEMLEIKKERASQTGELLHRVIL